MIFFLGYKITPYRDLKRPSGLKRSSSLRTPRGRRDSGSNESGTKCHLEIMISFEFLNYILDVLNTHKINSLKKVVKYFPTTVKN